MTKHIVAAFDVDDLPRCYGIAETVTDAAARCTQELRAYRQEKFKLGDRHQTACVYTLRTAIAEHGETWTFLGYDKV